MTDVSYSVLRHVVNKQWKFNTILLEQRDIDVYVGTNILHGKKIYCLYIFFVVKLEIL
jgi:hypothetical protein